MLTSYYMLWTALTARREESENQKEKARGLRLMPWLPCWRCQGTVIPDSILLGRQPMLCKDKALMYDIADFLVGLDITFWGCAV